MLAKTTINIMSQINLLNVSNSESKYLLGKLFGSLLINSFHPETLDLLFMGKGYFGDDTFIFINFCRVLLSESIMPIFFCLKQENFRRLFS